MLRCSHFTLPCELKFISHSISQHISRHRIVFCKQRPIITICHWILPINSFKLVFVQVLSCKMHIWVMGIEFRLRRYFLGKLHSIASQNKPSNCGNIFTLMDSSVPSIDNWRGFFFLCCLCQLEPLVKR